MATFRLKDVLEFSTINGIKSVDWEMATDENFTDVIASSYGDRENLTEWNVPLLLEGSPGYPEPIYLMNFEEDIREGIGVYDQPVLTGPGDPPSYMASPDGMAADFLDTDTGVQHDTDLSNIVKYGGNWSASFLVRAVPDGIVRYVFTSYIGGYDKCGLGIFIMDGFVQCVYTYTTSTVPHTNTMINMATVTVPLDDPTWLTITVVDNGAGELTVYADSLVGNTVAGAVAPAVENVTGPFFTAMNDSFYTGPIYGPLEISKLMIFDQSLSLEHHTAIYTPEEVDRGWYSPTTKIDCAQPIDCSLLIGCGNNYPPVADNDLILWVRARLHYEEPDSKILTIDANPDADNVNHSIETVWHVKFGDQRLQEVKITYPDGTTEETTATDLGWS